MIRRDDRDRPRAYAENQDRSSLLGRLFLMCFVLLLLPVTFVGVGYALEGRMIAEKVATRLVMPCGAIWCLLFSLALWSWITRARMIGVALLLVWIVYGVAGNGIVASRLVRTLEQDYLDQSPFEAGQFDVVVLLGGGTTIGPTGEYQLASNGDRLMTVARMYHGGQVDRIICTGEYINASDNQPQIGEVGAKLLTDVGVDEDRITILGGRNTKEEFNAIRVWLQEQPKLRIGVVTSAWHMRRAMKLAEANQVEIVPLPANFVSKEVVDVMAFVPGSSRIDTTGDVLKEYLGAMLGR